jgi:hypothetical protein
MTTVLYLVSGMLIRILNLFRVRTLSLTMSEFCLGLPTMSGTVLPALDTKHR